MTTTNSVTFSVDEVELLYSIPEPGGDLQDIIRAFVFLNRSAAPSFSTIRDSFTKSLQTSILLENEGQYRIATAWYRRIHANDDSAGNEIDSMLEFQDNFVGEQVPIINDRRFDVSEQKYSELLGGLQT
jgi:hypothetical protein